MRLTLPPTAPADLERLEAAAQARPGAYRLRLMLLGLFGDAFLTVVRAFPLAAPIVIGTLFYDHPFFNWAAAGGVLLILWLVRPSYRDTGEVIDGKTSPELVAAVDALKKDLDVGGRLEIRLSDEFNASARESRGLFGLLGTRRVMTLGVPLLAFLDKDEARAVIAHELGHFSRRHGRLGHWLYAAHMGWLAHVESVDRDSSILDKAGVGFAQLFVPMFNRRAMVWSRRCEYEADADAARAVGGQPLISGLVRLAAIEVWHERRLPRLMREWQRDEPAAPTDFLERLSRAFVRVAPELATEAMSREQGRDSAWLDTHPATAERARALQTAVQLLASTRTAGPALLGPSWTSIAAAFNARWQKAQMVSWAVGHTAHRLIDAPLLAAAAEETRGWPLEKRLARARALRAADPERGLGELRALADAAPHDRAVAFALAAAQAVDGDAAGAKSMIAIASADATYRIPACIRLIPYHARRGERAEVERWEAQLQTSGEEAMRSRARVRDTIEGGSVLPSRRDRAVVESIFAGLAADQAVARAWLLQSAAALDTSRTLNAGTLHVDVLLLIVDPFDKDQLMNDAEAIRDGHRQELTELIEHNAFAVVFSYFSTEPLPEPLQAALARLPGGVAYTRTS